MEKNPNLKAGLYRGPIARNVHDRTVPACESQWAQAIGVTSLDTLLRAQLEIAHSQQRPLVNLLDVGSGDGGLLKGIVNNPFQLPETTAFLTSNPNMQVNMLGLTDARTSANHLKEVTEITASKDSPLVARNIGYTLTSAQHLRDFLTHMNAEKTDLILATCSLQYLGPSTFNQTLRDALNSLRGPGSTMVTAVYSNLAPGVIVDPEKGFLFTIPGTNEGEPHFRKTLKFKGGRYKPGDETETATLIKTISKLVELGALEKECATGLIDKLSDQSPSESAFVLTNLITLALRRGESALAKMTIEKNKNQKTNILEGIKTDYPDIDLLINSRGFTGFLAVKK